jgi:hypothetical protein
LLAPKRRRDETFGADLAWFEGTPVMIAAAIAPGSWLARRVAQYGDSPCAILFAASGGMVGQKPSDWFGHSVFWTGGEKLGGRLGVWIER